MSVPVISVEEMRRWEAATWAAGIRESAVIKRVGRAVADWLLPRTRPSDSVLIVAGKGHNGDDGRAAAGYLLDRKTVLLDIRDPDQEAGRLEHVLAGRPSVILDCLFGIGLNRDLSSSWRGVIQRINRAPARTVAVDVPSGLNARSGLPMGGCVEVDDTLTIGAPKAGLLAPQARPFVGYLRILHDVGLVEWPCHREILFSQAEDFRGFPPRRRATDHKGSFGRLAIIAGSSGYHGAAVLAARGAMRAGPGLITLSTMPECYLPVGAQLQQVMVERWREDWQMPAKTTGILVGPGLAGPDVSDRLIGQVREIWRETEQPVVIDASSLDWLPRGTATAGPRVITPHAGEAAQLLKSQPDDVNGNPVACLRELSAQFGDCWVVLKGHHSLVGRRQGPVFFNATGNPGLAQGGSGDVLAGFLAGLIAQPRCQNDWETALRCGVWRHGEAADRLKKTRNNWTSEELPDAIYL